MKRFWQFMTRPRGRQRHTFFRDRPVRPLESAKGKQRGIALLMVTMCLAFVASVGADIGLSGEVRMLKAVHQRDELMADLAHKFTSSLARLKQYRRSQKIRITHGL